MRWRVAPDRLDNWLSVCNKLPFDGCVQQKYAYLNCCRKVNKICAECRQIAIFDDSKLMAAAVKLCEEDKKFTIAYVLAGLIGLRNPDTESQAEQYLQQVTEREKGVVYADFVYYVLGEYYEVDRHDWMFGWMWYQRMVGCPLQERRGKPVSDGMYNIKLSNRMIQTGQTDEAWKILTEMKEKLEEKYTLGYISLDDVSMWYQCTRMMEDMQRFSERNMCFLECHLIVSSEPLTGMLKFGILQIMMADRTSSRQSEQRQKRNRQLLA